MTTITELDAESLLSAEEVVSSYLLLTFGILSF